MKKVKKYLFNGLATLLILMTVYIIVAAGIAFFQKKDAVIFNHSISVVASDSMEDTIMTGEFIIYRHASFEDIKVGDIAVFKYVGSNNALKGKNIVHRVIAQNGDGTYETRGDKYGVGQSDAEALTAANYIGKVVTHTPLFGLGKLRLGSLGIFFGIIILAFVVLIVIEIRSFVKNYQKVLEEERRQKLLAELKEELKEEELKK